MKRGLTANRKLQSANWKFAGGSGRLCVTIIVAVGALALGLYSPSAAFSASAKPAEPPKIVGVRVGLADDYKVGLWTQVEVTLLGGSGPVAGKIAVIVSDSDGVPTRVSEARSREIQPGRETKVRLLTRFGRVDGDLTVEFSAENGVLARRTFTASSHADGEHFLYGMESQKLLLAVGASTFDTGDLDKVRGVELGLRHVVAPLDDVEQLPLEWNAYEGVDTVLLFTSQPKIYDRLAGDDVRLRALEQWIRLGGRLVLCVGANGSEVLARQSPLLRFVNGRFEKMAPLPQTNALENYCGSPTAILGAGGAQSSLRVPKLTAVQGVVEAQEGDRPLVIRTAWGFGQVIFVAADLDQPPLSHWPDRALFLAKLLDVPPARSDELAEKTAIMHFGYNDLAGQLRSALEQFTGVEAVSFSLVAGLIVLYVLLIGPGDYFFLRKVVRRMTWTWLTLPLLVMLVSVGAYYLTHYLKGNQCRLNQADLVDVDVSSGLVRGTTWANVFSPRLKTFQFALQPKLPNGKAPSDARVLLSWFGLPGGALGGMNPRTLAVSLWSQPYDFSPNLDAMSGVPIQVGSTKSLTARWVASADGLPQGDLADDGGLLSGRVTNTLDFPLEQCLLAYGSSVYELGTIAQNDSARIDAMSNRSELKTLLSGRKVVVRGRDTYRQEATPYDQSNTDISYVLRMMMFHDAAGGRRYTGLFNEYQSFVDFDPLLKTDRAILVAQAPADAKPRRDGAQLLDRGERWEHPQDKHVTLYRFVFPVKKSGEGRAERAERTTDQLAALPQRSQSAPRPFPHPSSLK
jgi:hypothetical protein